jgi:predicted AAA+ superfamily ATPase
MVEGYAKRYKLGVPVEDLRKQAIEWSVTRGARSGRVAWQFIQEVAGQLGKKLE